MNPAYKKVARVIAEKQVALAGARHWDSFFFRRPADRRRRCYTGVASPYDLEAVNRAVLDSLDATAAAYAMLMM